MAHGAILPHLLHFLEIDCNNLSFRDYLFTLII